MSRDILIGIIVPLSILLPIGIFMFKYRYADRSMKIIFFYLVVAGLINLLAILLVKMKMRNLPLLHLYTVIETVFFLAYFQSIFEDKKIRKYLTAAMLIFPILCVLNFLFIQDIFTFNTHTRPLEAILITFVCLLYLYKSGFVEDLMKRPLSWINVGIIVYFPVASIIFLLSNYFVFKAYNKDLTTLVWNIHSLLVLAMYLFFAKGFSLIKKDDR